MTLARALSPEWEDPMMELHFIPGQSPAMRAIENVVERLAAMVDPILITGEAAVGKRALAFRIHQLSKRLGEPFRDVACSDLSPDAPELLAYVNGESGPGTLALIEIGELSLPAQSRLVELYFGQKSHLDSLPRLIATSSRDLRQEIQAKRFRDDLYAALASICISVPALRFRREDLSVLALHYLQTYTEIFGRRMPEVSEDSLAFLSECDWPGNFRDFKAAMKMWAAVGDERLAFAAMAAAAQSSHDAPNREATSLKQIARSASRQAEKELILDVLSSTGWNRKRAAQQLQISYKALLYKLKQIHREDPKVLMEPL